MKATILAISDSDKHFADASKEYEKRLESHVYIQLIKPYKHKSIDMVISKETESIQEILDKKFSHYHKVLLSIQGQEMHSQEFSQWCHKHSEIVFIIGGPYGLDRAKMQNSINQEISL
jgi:23S rRNA pseudoU1915 N3-methylase RlmH